MKNKKLILLGVVACSLLLLGGFAIAGSQKEHFDLNAVGSSSGQGTAYVRSWMLQDLNFMELHLWVEGLPMVPGWVYEIWLVDMDTNTKLSIGSFQTDPAHKKEFSFKQSMVNPWIYDKVVVTKEPMNDIDPAPHTAVLEGIIPDSWGTSVTMHALLKGRYEIPGTSSRATGHGTFTVDTVANKVMYNVVYHDLDGAETGAHIHGFASREQTEGILHDFGLGTTKIRTWNYNEDQEERILAGLTYANVHSHVYPNGEIRGQIEIDS